MLYRSPRLRPARHVLLGLGLAVGALAAPEARAAQEIASPDRQVEFGADQLDYDSEAGIVTATGTVVMARDGARLRADRIIWNRNSGEVVAEGQVSITSAEGDTAYGDSVVVTDTLRDGVVENLLMVLAEGGRLVADKATRTDGVTTLSDAAYTPCAVIGSNGCPREPTWKISAVRVVHDPAKRRIFYKGARLSLLGAPIVWLPGFSHPDGSDSSGTGLLVPNLRYSRTNGFEIEQPWYLSLAPNRDLKLTPHIYSEVLPALEAQFRALTGKGAIRIEAMGTYSDRSAANLAANREPRGYVDIAGRFQTSPHWTLSTALLAASDKSFMRRYDVSDADRLRSTINAERIGQRSYLSIAGWVTQTLRIGDSQQLQPAALPLIDWRWRAADPLFGGRIELQANSLSLLRTGGQDTQRAFVGLDWNLRTRVETGQELSFTLYGRGDVYHTDETLDTATALYRGTEGWSTRAIAAAALDMRWPLFGPLGGGTQLLTPRVQLAVSPQTANLRLPNEDSRALDLEEGNLFALNRFPGYDRWEDGSRITYGVDWNFSRPHLGIDAVLGQSYRLNSESVVLPVGTGLSGRFSDIVGRTTLRWRNYLALTHRFRLDKSSLAVRRNEINATIGTRRTYALVGYMQLNRGIDTAIEDLRDREELQLAGRLQFARYWSIFASSVVDLTDAREDPAAITDGWQPVRHRAELLYEDDCIQIGASWRRDYVDTGDRRRGNSFLLRLALKNLGR